MKRDNSTLLEKSLLRRNALKNIENPVVMETHGGIGEIWKKCYEHIDTGVVFEKDARKSSILSRQRQTWSVYECDCISALMGGAGRHLNINFLDIDPYGEPWPVVDAFFQSDREFPNKLAIVANDGLRHKLKMNGGWSAKSMQEIVREYGNHSLYENYLDICQELIKRKASQRGYSLAGWAGYYCGHNNTMTHYAAILAQ